MQHTIYLHSVYIVIWRWFAVHGKMCVGYCILYKIWTSLDLGISGNPGTDLPWYWGTTEWWRVRCGAPWPLLFQAYLLTQQTLLSPLTWMLWRPQGGNCPYPLRVWERQRGSLWHGTIHGAQTWAQIWGFWSKEEGSVTLNWACQGCEESPLR
jgi:hypothetical protein